MILPHRLKRLRTSSRCRSSISEAYGYQQIIALYTMLISGGVARLADSVAGYRLYAELLALASEIWSAPAQPVQLAAAWAFTEPPEVRERIASSRQPRRHCSRDISGS